MGVAALAVFLIAWTVYVKHGPSSVRTILLDQSVGDVAVDAATHHVLAITSRLDGSHARVRIIDMATGALVHSIPISDQPVALGVAAHAGHLFVIHTGASGAYVTMFDIRSGAVLRVVPVDPNPQAIEVYEQMNRVFVISRGIGFCPVAVASRCGVQHSSVSVLDAQTGKLLRRLHVAGGVVAIGVDTWTRRIVIASSNHTSAAYISLLDAMTGRMLRRVSIPREPGPIAVDEATGHAFVVVDSANGITPTGQVYMLDMHTGSVMHVVSLGHAPEDVAVDDKAGRVFVTTQGTSRLVTFTFPTQGGVSPSGGSIWMPTGKGNVYMADTQTGKVLRIITVGVAPRSVLADARHRHVFVLNAGSSDDHETNGSSTVIVRAPLTAPASVSVLDATSGTVLRTNTLNTSPQAMRLDELTGRILIINHGSLMPVPVSDPWAWVPLGLRHLLPMLPPPPRSHTHIVPGSLSILDETR